MVYTREVRHGHRRFGRTEECGRHQEGREQAFDFHSASQKCFLCHSNNALLHDKKYSGKYLIVGCIDVKASSVVAGHLVIGNRKHSAHLEYLLTATIESAACVMLQAVYRH